MLTVLSLFSLILVLVTPSTASPCLAFDSNFVLYVFGLGGKDYSFGSQDTWNTDSETLSSHTLFTCLQLRLSDVSGGKFTDITSSNSARPYVLLRLASSIENSQKIVHLTDRKRPASFLRRVPRFLL